MANQIIILGTVNNNLTVNVNAVFWYPISSGAKAQSGVSAWPNASAAENTAIQNGSILEEFNSFQFPTGYATAMIQAFLLQTWANRNAQLGGVGPGQFQNVGFNGTAWVANIA